MIKHTPGPWKASMKYSQNGSLDIQTDCPIEFDIAETIGGFGDGVQQANAKLIAAGPDLLEALQALIDFDEITTAITMAGGTPHIMNAKKAIQKATEL